MNTAINEKDAEKKKISAFIFIGGNRQKTKSVNKWHHIFEG